jgi:hypothetical protein
VHPDSCRLCEHVAPDVFRRHWKHEPKAGAWHLIAAGADVMARLPRRAHFLTVLSYREADGALHYHGPLYFEFDADDPAKALDDLHQCLQILDVDVDCPMEAIHTWHSGRRGFHVTIPSMVCGAEAGHPALPKVYAAMLDELFPAAVAPTLDRTIYSRGKGRMWRLPNRRRSDTGRYKVPLAVRDILHTSYAELEALTTRPRRGLFWPPDEDLSPCPALVQRYREAAAAVMSSPGPTINPSDDGRIPESRRNSTLTSLAGAMRRRGATQEGILAALLVENQRCDPPLDEAELRDIAHSIARYAPHEAHGLNGHSREPDHDPWLGPRSAWHGVPAPVWKEVCS